MHEIYLVKVPETVNLLAQTAPITIMTRSPHLGSYTFLMLVLPSITSLANNLKKYRVQSGLSQEEIADKCGMHRTYIRSIECYRRSISL